MQEEDCLVVGAGVIGLSVAYALSERGLSVRIIDANRAGRGCSWANGGLLVPSHCVPFASPEMLSKAFGLFFSKYRPFHLNFFHNSGLGPWLWHFLKHCRRKHVENVAPIILELAQGSLQLYKEWQKQEGHSFFVESKGVISICRSKKGMAELRKQAKILEKLDVSARVIENKEELRSIEPDIHSSVLGGVHFPEDCHLQSGALVQSLVRRLKRRKIIIEEDTKALKLIIKEGRVESLQTSKGSFPVRNIVIAAGAASDSLLKSFGLRLPLQAARGYSLTYYGDEDSLRNPLMLEEAKIVVSPLKGQLRLSGFLDFSGSSLAINPRQILKMKSYAGEYLTKLPQTQHPPLQWAGLRPCTPDGLPYLGRSSLAKNLVLATGHGMLGMTLAPMTGLLCTELLLGEKTSMDIRKMSPDRYQ